MCSLKKYLVLSLLFHTILILILVDAHSSSRKDDPLKVLEVSIVTNISQGNMDEMKFSFAHQGKNIIK
jgi:hypothetical protein